MTASTNLDQFDSTDWAFEFLRRNPLYQADWHRTAAAELPIILTDGTLQLRLRRRYPKAEAWGLCTFADPAKDAISSPVFWHPYNIRRVISAQFAVEQGTEAPAISLSSFAGCRLAVAEPNGETFVLLKRGGIFAGLKSQTPAVLTQRFALTFQLHGFNDLSGQTDTLRDLQRMMNAASGASLRSVFADDRRLRELIVALDGSLNGKSYRQIAIALLGEERVAEDWNTASRFLKDRMRRLVAKAHEMMNGGYRGLLQ